MALVARIIGLSLVTGGLGAALGIAFFREDYAIPSLLLACAGGIVGSIAGAAREVAAAQREKTSG